MNRSAVPVLAAGLALALSGCNQAGDTPTAAATPSEPAKPAFAADGPTVVRAIQSYGAPWNAAKTSDPMVDSKTGGLVRVLNGADGSAQVFSRRDGNAWQIRLVTGAPNNCGVSEPLLAALPKLASLLKPGTTISQADRNIVNDGLLAFDRKTQRIAGMDVTTQGGCTHWLTLAVPETAAPPAV